MLENIKNNYSNLLSYGILLYINIISTIILYQMNFIVCHSAYDKPVIYYFFRYQSWGASACFLVLMLACKPGTEKRFLATSLTALNIVGLLGSIVSGMPFSMCDGVLE